VVLANTTENGKEIKESPNSLRYKHNNIFQNRSHFFITIVMLILIALKNYEKNLGVCPATSHSQFTVYFRLPSLPK